MSLIVTVVSADPCVLVSYSVIASIPKVLVWTAFFLFLFFFFFK